jgi:hypothetical protein
VMMMVRRRAWIRGEQRLEERRGRGKGANADELNGPGAVISATEARLLATMGQGRVARDEVREGAGH